MPLRRVFVANRGEIAVRIIRACRELGIESVLGVSEADRTTLGALQANRTVCIGPARAAKSYLDVPTLVTAAVGTGCDAVHPGYGFLAERADFARACAENGLQFVGPSAEAIESMGDKSRARELATVASVPVVPGSPVLVDKEAARRSATELGFPVLLKACAGGGGRGMRIVRDEKALAQAFMAASAEAQAAFGDGSMYLERYIENGRHIEIQIMGDRFGSVVHFFDRDCSIQRRHQKLIEEAPSTSVDDGTRTQMAADAVKLARAVSYVGAGTIEFIYDMDRRAYHFLEMNTRIQVEHPVTEVITGVDLLAEQIRVCAGLPLSFEQGAIVSRGHAIECRINAEKPASDFQPSPGEITEWRPPTDGGVRLDTHCYSGYVVPPHYDSLLAKVIVHGATRASAIEKMQQALNSFVIGGVTTTISFQAAIMTDTDYRQGETTTSWVEKRFMERWGSSTPTQR